MGRPEVPSTDKYDGPLYEGKLGNHEVETAYRSWCDQRSRCNNPKHRKYRWWGAKGIRVLYSAREFIGWWVLQQSLLKLKRPSCSRINHSGNYCFANIRLEELSENAAESSVRMSTKKRVSLVAGKRVLERFSSMGQAARFADMSVQSVAFHCTKKYKTMTKGIFKGCTFRYET